MKVSAALEEETERAGRGEAPRDAEAWQGVPLGKACRQDRQIVEPGSREAGDLPYLSLEHVESQTGRILKQTDTPVEDEGKSTTFRFDTRHVLYGKLRPYLNKVALPDFAGRCTTEMIPLLPADGVDRQFLAWLLRREETIAWALRQNTGSRMPRADMDSLLTLSIPLPPLPEQERIAGRMTEQLAAVERARAAAQSRLDAAEALPAAYLREVFEGPEASAWETSTLGELCNGNGQYGTSAKSNGQQRGLPVLGMPHIHEGRIRWTKLFHADLPPDELENYRLVKGDLLFNRTNSAELVGKTAVFDGAREAVFASYLIRYRVLEDRADSRFVSAYINSRQGRTFIERHMARASGQVNISASTMSTMPIPLPVADRQREIMDREHLPRLAGAELLASQIRAELAAIEALPAALLREAFSVAQ